MTYLEILCRCCEAPEDHLAEASLRQFQAYQFGYGMRCEAPCPWSFDDKAIERAIKADYKLPVYWPRAAHFFSFLTVAEGKAAALRKAHEYLSRFELPRKSGENWFPHGIDLIKLLSSPDFRERPGMYFGEDSSAEHLWSMLSGACWAERDSGTERRTACDLMVRFQARIERLEPYSRGIPWHRILMMFDGHRYSFQGFLQHYDRMIGTVPDPFAENAKPET